MNNDSSNVAKHILEMERTGDAGGRGLNADFPNESLTNKRKKKGKGNEIPGAASLYGELCIIKSA